MIRLRCSSKPGTVQDEQGLIQNALCLRLDFLQMDSCQLPQLVVDFGDLDGGLGSVHFHLVDWLLALKSEELEVVEVLGLLAR